MPPKRIRETFAAGVAVGALFGWGVPVGARVAAAERPADGVAEMPAEIATLEKKAAEAASAGDHAGAAFWLERAAAKQRLRLELGPADAEQQAVLERLVVARDNERAQAVGAQVDSLEEKAGAAGKEGKTDTALPALREALNLQRAVDDSRAAERFKNFARELRLRESLRDAEAEPLARELEAALRDARAAAAEQRWPEAAAAYAKVRAKRGRLARDFARTRWAGKAKLAEIDAELEAFAPAGAAAEIDRLEKEGEAAEGAGKIEAAARSYAAARDGQMRLNASFAGSRFASPQRVEQIETKRQTMLAAERLAKTRALDGSATQHLAKRETLAAERDIAAAAAELESMQKDFPRTRDSDGGLKIKVDYLRARGLELGALQDSVYDRLVPIAGRRDILMLREDVPQAMYAKVMSTNPSRNRGEERAVDSVNGNEAREFCRRLSWVLGRRVRLPSAAEWRAAREDGVVGVGGTDGPREWVLPDASGSELALVGGGNADEPWMAGEAELTGRPRGVIFRVVVEYRIE
jgi:hypothetical protein